MTMSNTDVNQLKKELKTAAKIMRDGGVIAYPTESCFGLGCDPRNLQAVRRLLALKCRDLHKGLILIGSSIQHIEIYADIADAPKHADILKSWPGPNTWLLTPTQQVSEFVRGEHDKIAIRVTAHPIAAMLCEAFDGAIVSTSANLQGQTALKTAMAVKQQFGDGLDHIVSGEIGSDVKPSTIRDGFSGEILRK